MLFVKDWRVEVGNTLLYEIMKHPVSLFTVEIINCILHTLIMQKHTVQTDRYNQTLGIDRWMFLHSLMVQRFIDSTDIVSKCNF